MYFFPPYIGQSFIILKDDNHMIYETSGTYSKNEEYNCHSRMYKKEVIIIGKKSFIIQKLVNKLWKK